MNSLGRAWFCLLAVLCLDAAFGESQSTQPVKRPSPAIWNVATEKAYGLSEADFRRAGLQKLTKEEYESLMGWLGAQYASRIQNATNLIPADSCGRPFSANDTFDKVKLFLNFSEQSPSEFVSAVRERLRNKSDVEIVFNEAEANVVVRILTFYNENQNGYRTGITVSAVTLEHCNQQAKALNINYDFQRFNAQYLQTSANVSAAVETLVSTLDTNDLEEARKSNAMLKKFAESTKHQ